MSFFFSFHEAHYLVVYQATTQLEKEKTMRFGTLLFLQISKRE